MEAYKRWIGKAEPRIQKILRKNGRLVRSEIVDYSSNLMFQVRYNLSLLHVLDVRAKIFLIMLGN